jgi:hypothetical protein
VTSSCTPPSVPSSTVPHRRSYRGSGIGRRPTATSGTVVVLEERPHGNQKSQGCWFESSRGSFYQEKLLHNLVVDLRSHKIPT